MLQRPRAGEELCVFKEQKESQCAWTKASEGESVVRVERWLAATSCQILWVGHLECFGGSRGRDFKREERNDG